MCSTDFDISNSLIRAPEAQVRNISNLVHVGSQIAMLNRVGNNRTPLRNTRKKGSSGDFGLSSGTPDVGSKTPIQYSIWGGTFWVRNFLPCDQSQQRGAPSSFTSHDATGAFCDPIKECPGFRENYPTIYPRHQTTSAAPTVKLWVVSSSPTRGGACRVRNPLFEPPAPGRNAL